MNLAVIGSGGREHAICYKLKQSTKIKKIICIPGNAGTQKIAKNIYRFMPIQMTSDDLSMVHGSNEKISIDSFITMIHFYYQLIKNIHAS